MTSIVSGAQAEQTAYRYLLRQGLRPVTRNYRCRRGEIDLIMRDGDSLVFIEVRYRCGAGFGGGAESVDRRKREKIIRCALYYLQQHPREQQRPARFDVVSLDGGQGLHWIRNAFEV